MVLYSGDSSSIEDSFKAGAIQNVAKGLHNGGCNATHTGNNNDSTFPSCVEKKP